MPRLLRPAALVAALLAVAPPAVAAVPPSPCGSLGGLRALLAAAQDDAARAAAAGAFADCAKREGTPLLFPAPGERDVRALFVFRSAAPRVFLAGDMNGWSTSARPLERLEGTDLHALELDVVDGARLDYKLVVGGTEWTLDPWNPRTMTGGFGPNSELRTPAYVPPAEVEPGPATVRGTWEELKVESRATGGPRTAFVWSAVPPGAPGPFPVLYLLDGTDYRDFAKAHVVAGNLVGARKLPPLLLVFVPPVDRRSEYERSAAFERFLVEELVPAVEARWPVRKDAAGRGVVGVSLGGFAALSATARHPGVFGRCGAQSTGNAVSANLDLLLADLARLPAGAVRFHVDVGTYEADLHGADLLAVSRRLRAALARRQPLEYREVSEGHSWGSWRARLAGALTFFWGDERPAGGEAPLAPRPAPVAPADRVSLDVKDADLAGVVATLVSGRGLSVVAPPGLSGSVTATLHDVPWDEALRVVLASNGWDVAREGNVLRLFRRGEP